MQKKIGRTIFTIVFSLFIILASYFIQSNSHYFSGDGITFVYNTMNLPYKDSGDVTTAWIMGNVSITPPVITINNTTVTATEITKKNFEKLYVMKLSESPSVVIIHGIKLHKSIPISLPILSIIITPIIVGATLIFFNNINTQMLIALYIIIILITVLVSIERVYYIEDTHFVSNNEIKIIHPSSTNNIIIFTAKPYAEYILTTPTIICNSTTQSIIYENNKIGFIVPQDCKTVFINDMPHKVKYLFYPEKYLFIALFIINTFLFGMTIILYDYFVE